MKQYEEVLHRRPHRRGLCLAEPDGCGGGAAVHRPGATAGGYRREDEAEV